MSAGYMLVAIAGADDEYANAKPEIAELSPTERRRRELPGAWAIEVKPMPMRDGAPRACVTISQYGFQLDIFIVAKDPRGGELRAPASWRWDRTDEYPLFVVIVDFAKDGGGGSECEARAA